MIDQIINLLGYESVDTLPYFGEHIIILFVCLVIFFGALAFFDAILKIIFGLFPGKD